jgi:ribosomal protein S18 acetylase RimI-like enzyme
MSNSIRICIVQKNEIDQLIKLSIETFCETFSGVNTEENIHKYIQSSLNSNKILSEISNPNSIFYFAKIKDEIVGYFKINLLDAQTENMGNDSIELERIYILKEFQRKGIGQDLIQFVIDYASSISKNEIWLGVWSENYSAIEFYKKLGFIECGKHIFRLGDDEQIDHIMKLEIK